MLSNPSDDVIHDGLLGLAHLDIATKRGGHFIIFLLARVLTVPMAAPDTNNIRILKTADIVPPCQVRAEYPVSAAARDLISSTRSEIERIISGEDPRLLVICGPCSVHDCEAGLEYANRLLKLREQYRDSLLIVMRVYFEKPRTRVGWKGLINDPNLNGTFDIDKGLRTARKLLCDVSELGLPAATEFLDPVTPQYTAELVSWGCIGARTVESQVHREMASGLSCPIGFKNTTRGGLQEAVDAIVTASRPHTFLSVTDDGRVAVLTSKGNQACHIVMRGGHQPNYSRASLEQAADLLQTAGLSPRIMVDVSHANSNKDASRQPIVIDDLGQQLESADSAVGQPHLMGVMIESFLEEGRQDIQNLPLTFGQSVTDACISWQQTEQTLARLSDALGRSRL